MKNISQKGPVSVVRLGDETAALDLIGDAARDGAACVWIRNAVDDAIAAVTALRARGIDASLLHARFALCDRKRIEQRELARFGRDGQGRAGRVLVATQVVESSLDLDFDCMVSDLAPMAALIQRAGRLWRHMAERPRAARPVPGPVLHVLSPAPGDVQGEDWLREVLGGGAWVYPLAEQWRTADLLFRIGEIRAPEGLRALIEPVHGDKTAEVPALLEGAEQARIGEGYARRTLGGQNVIDFVAGYRQGASGPDDERYPTRLGRETRKLALARWQDGCLLPWAGGDAPPGELWQLSEVQADKVKLDRLPLPDQSAPDIVAATEDWPDWRRKAVTLCPVGEGGTICEGLSYSRRDGLLFPACAGMNRCLANGRGRRKTVPRTRGDDREDLVRVVGQGASVDLLIDDIQAELVGRPYELAQVTGGWMFRTRPQFAEAIKAAADLGDQSLVFTGMEMGVLCAFAYYLPIDRAGLADIFGQKISRDLLARLRYKDLIASGPRSPRPGAPHTFVTTETFLVTFDLQSLRDLPELELPNP